MKTILTPPHANNPISTAGLALMVLLLVAAQFTTSAAEGDVTINATSTPNVPCADCPGGQGTQLCYEVTLAEDADHNNAKDFHIQVNSANENLFKCLTIAEQNGPNWDDRTGTWKGGHSSTREEGGTVRRHYVGWYGNQPGSEPIRKGETWRFCVVYCGSTNNLDNTIEYTLTDTGNGTLADLNDFGERPDVPNGRDKKDDPGWKGVWTNSPGSQTGFICASMHVEPGLDFYTTPINSASQIDFATNPIPANFFDPGSEPFTNFVVLQGGPLPTFPPLLPGPVDTIVRRPTSALIPFGGGDTVPIELVALHLVSAQPITVRYTGGASKSWDVRVTPSITVTQQPGTITLKTSSNGTGGTFQSDLPIRPRFIFTNPGNGDQRTLDYGLLPDLPLIPVHYSGHWTDYAPAPLNVVTSAPGLMVDHDGDPITPMVGPLPGTSTDFHSSLRYDFCYDQELDDLIRPRMLIGTGPSTTRLMFMPAMSPSPDSEGDGVPDKADNCLIMPNPLQEDADNDGVGDLCDNCTVVYNPCQENSDGIGLGDACQFMVPMSPGSWALGNNYSRSNQTLAVLLPSPPNNTTVWFWDPTLQQFSPPSIYVLGPGWQFPPGSGVGGPTWGTGHGAIITTPLPHTITFTGDTIAPPKRPRLPPGKYFVACPAPRPCGFEELMGFPPAVGDTVERFVNPLPTPPPAPPTPNHTHTFGPSTWVPSDPIISPGEAVFVTITPVLAPQVEPYRLPGGIELIWNTSPGVDYTVESKSPIDEPLWHERATIRATGLAESWMEDLLPGIGGRYYRVRAHLVP